MGPSHVARTLPLLLALAALALAVPHMAAPTSAQLAQAPARVTLVHAAPLADTGPVTITIDKGSGDLPAAVLSFGESAGYQNVEPGARSVKLFAGALDAGQIGGATPLLTASVALAAGKDYTLAAVGGANGFPLEILTLADNNTPPAQGFASVRAAHLAPFAAGSAATAVDIVYESGQALDPFLNLRFKDVSGYRAIPSDPIFDLKIVPSGQPGAPPLIDLPPRSFARGKVLSLFVIGGANGREARIIELEQTLRRPARLQVIHAAPGDGGPNPLNLLINGVRRLENVPFPTVVEPPLALDEGLYTLAVEKPGNPPGVLASVDALLRADIDYIALIRPGADGQGVSITVEPSVSEAPPGPGQGWLVFYHLAPFDTGDRGRLDVRNNKGELVSNGLAAVGYGERRVVAVPARDYDLRLTTPGGGTQLVDVGEFTLNEGGVARIYAVGATESGPSGSLVQADPLEVTIFFPLVVD